MDDPPIELEGVVVGALFGIKRSKDAVTSASTVNKRAFLHKQPTLTLYSQLVGKVSGLQINRTG
jgi:hypothetical protein